MQRLKAELKVAGGKLVRVSVQTEGGRVESLKLTGDFFLHPEDSISKIEECVRGAALEDDGAEIAGRIDSLARRDGLLLVGFSGSDVAKAIIAATATSKKIE
ncbi:hypothetical protein HY095_03225 [Candidatus Micrarchaeota archaeon]|nr:hypothetical protein [Candidatus Micrarchaeota archaeon]